MACRACLAFIVIASVAFAQTEGDVVSRTDLVRDIPANENHPVPRKVLKVNEGAISCKPSPLAILVVHYRAEHEAQFSMKDDRLVIALK